MRIESRHPAFRILGSDSEAWNWRYLDAGSRSRWFAVTWSFVWSPLEKPTTIYCRYSSLLPKNPVQCLVVFIYLFAVTWNFCLITMGWSRWKQSWFLFSPRSLGRWSNLTTWIFWTQTLNGRYILPIYSCLKKYPRFLMVFVDNHWENQPWMVCAQIFISCHYLNCKSKYATHLLMFVDHHGLILKLKIVSWLAGLLDHQQN